MRILLPVLLSVFVLGCSKKSDPSPPDAASLVFPEQNSECTTGIDQSPTTSEVEFRWQESDNTETYEVRATQLLTNVIKTTSTTATSASLTIDKGAPYSWQVITRNSQTETSTPSTVWRFYNAGSQTTYAPFPAEIESPKSGESIPIDTSGQITLSWSGADIENDITGYDVYHGTANPPADIVESTLPGKREVQVDVSPGVYYWKVVTKDREGNTSDSGIFSYRAF
ncbi:MAG: hypothetical protein WBM43_08870 [Flavobacteriaceae bacterium]